MIGSTVGGTCRLHAIYMTQSLSIWEKCEKLSSAGGKAIKIDLQATGCAGGSSYRTLRSAHIRLRDQIESEISRSWGSIMVPAVAARVSAGNCSTVARWPAHKRVTRTSWPSG